MTILLWTMVALFAIAVLFRVVLTVALLLISLGALIGRGAFALAHGVRAALGSTLR